MTIETKYNIGDEVWANVLDKPYNFMVKGIKFVCDGFYKRITYTLLEEGEDIFIFLDEEELYPTKEELLKSL
jgi:hypothetical protein